MVRCLQFPEGRAVSEPLPTTNATVTYDPSFAGATTAAPAASGSPAALTATGDAAAGEPGSADLASPRRYVLVEKIGEGGMGAVWKAEQTHPVRRPVAVKLILSGRDSRLTLARFAAERQALAVMDHPHIAKVFDAGACSLPDPLAGGALGPTGPTPYFVMELVDGVPLTAFCDDHRLTVPQRLDLFQLICHAVQHAHQKGVIHRDLKPGNILVQTTDSRPTPKVIDFGLAKALGERPADAELTGHGAILGTPLYMAPEQATQDGMVDVDTRADVYALGVVLYELLTGTTPIPKSRVRQAALHEVMRVIREDDPLTPSSRVTTGDATAAATARHTDPKRLAAHLRGDLDRVVMKALSKERDRRYGSAAAFAEDVARYLRHEPVSASPPSAGYRLRKFIRRNRGPVVAAGLVLLALLAGVAGTTAALFEAKRQERIAVREAGEKEAAWRREAGLRIEAEASELTAVVEREKATRAADAEKAAHLLAVERMTQLRKGHQLLTGIFRGLDFNQTGGDALKFRLTLGERFKAAAGELKGEAVGDPLTVADLQTALAGTLSAFGYHTDAATLDDEAWKTRKRLLGDGHADTLKSLGYLAESRRMAGQTDQAVTLAEEAVRKSRVEFGPDDSKTLGNTITLALCHEEAGRSDQAIRLLEEVRDTSTARHGVDHPLTVRATACLGGLLWATRKLDQALPLLQAVFDDRTAKLGPDHPDTLFSLNNLASCYWAAKKPDRAAPLFEDALARYRATLGPDHPDTLLCMNNLAASYLDLGRHKAGLDLYDDVVKRSKAALGLDHPRTLQFMGGQGTAYWTTRQLDRSVPLFEEVYRRQEAKHGRNHPDTLQTAANLGVNYHDAGRSEEAAPLLEAAYRGSKTVPRLRWTGPKLLDVYLRLGDAKRGVPLATELMAAARKAHPANSPPLAAELTRTGRAYLTLKAWPEAEAVLRECLSIRERIQPEAWPTHITKSLLGEALAGRKKWADAEPLLTDGYAQLKRVTTPVPQQRGYLRDAAQRLVDLYTATGDDKKAAVWVAERDTHAELLPPPRKQ
jgi:serine/threonine protein kinase/tetratricopeptide (TPR) repeat protein